MSPGGEVVTSAAQYWFTFEPETLAALSRPLRTEPATVHVWAFNLDGNANSLDLCRNWLSPEERERADRFAFPHLRTRYTTAHGILRRLLSLYCDQSPETLRFEVTAAGKPSLRGTTPKASALSFNLTHSQERAAVAVSTGIALGIDLECLRDEVDILGISGRYFFGAEHDAIRDASPEARSNTFFRYWVAKEAVLKAEGIGLGFPLDHFRVDFHPGDESARIETLHPARLGGDWTVRMLPCEPGWLGAVAARGTDWGVKIEGPGDPGGQL